MARFRTVLFDLDGTLIDTNDLVVTSFQHVFREHLGREVPAEQIYTHFGEPLSRTMAHYAPDRVGEFCDLYRTFNLAHHDRLIRQFPGMLDATDRLKKAGIKLAVVTSKFTQTAKRGLAVCQLAPFFDVVVGMDQTEKHKPDPEPCLEALRRLGEEAGPQVLMVGDSPFDIQCGRNAGLRTAAVEWTVNRQPLEASRPDYWVADPGDLVRLVLGEG